MKLVILDRDGVLCAIPPDGKNGAECFALLPKTADAVALLNQYDFSVAVASNESCIGRKTLTFHGLNEQNKKLHQAVRQSGGEIAGIWFCPHRAEELCDCRKPMKGLIDDILERFAANAAETYMVGDSMRDMLAYEAAGGIPILVMTGKGKDTLSKWGEELPERTQVFQDLWGFCQWLCAAGAPDGEGEGGREGLGEGEVDGADGQAAAPSDSLPADPTGAATSAPPAATAFASAPATAAEPAAKPAAKPPAPAASPSPAPNRDPSPAKGNADKAAPQASAAAPRPTPAQSAKEAQKAGSKAKDDAPAPQRSPKASEPPAPSEQNKGPKDSLQAKTGATSPASEGALEGKAPKKAEEPEKPEGAKEAPAPAKAQETKDAKGKAADGNLADGSDRKGAGKGTDKGADKGDKRPQAEKTDKADKIGKTDKTGKKDKGGAANGGGKAGA